MRKLGLLRFNTINNKIISFLQSNLSKIFSDFFDSVDIIEDKLKISNEYYNHNRRQYNGPIFLMITRNKAIDLNYDKVLGIFPSDLYTKGLSFIFGLAESGTGSRACVISLERLHPSFYDNTIDKNTLPEIYLKRILKEAMHEIGHTLGLKHCNNVCVMRFSNSLPETDAKPANFCDECKKKIQLS
ncbi:MAG: archemetzincin [Promethearchaeota archaeon]|nr:MAG: archemetzincin [Candidatus Lokiarchaeota archaeon]